MQHSLFLRRLAGFLFVAVLAMACAKSSSIENPLGNQSVSLYLTDGPGYFDQVFVDIKSVQILVDTTRNTRKNDTCNWDRIGAKPMKNDSSLLWFDLGVKAGVYDILKLRNGTDTLLGNKTIPAGAVRLIRIEIGTQNSLVKDSITYPLNWPANVPPYVLIKLKGQEWDEFLPGQKRLWLDFDITRSIVVERNNQFFLRPFLKQFVPRQMAQVVGKIVPPAAKAVLTLYNSTDTAYALPNPEGYFKLRGLKEGNYSLLVNGSNGYGDTTINNINISNGKETSLGLITLKK